MRRPPGPTRTATIVPYPTCVRSMFYVGGDDEARKGAGIGIGSVSVHPGGCAHGPQPSAIEASLGAEAFDDSAVMVDTFAPLDLGEAGIACEDEAYAWTWAAG